MSQSVEIEIRELLRQADVQNRRREFDDNAMEKSIECIIQSD